MEIQACIAQKNYEAAAGLAYACHNLPSFQLGMDPYFNWSYFRRCFTRYHELHGKVYCNYLAMLKAAEDGEEVSPEVVFAPLETA